MSTERRPFGVAAPSGRRRLAPGAAPTRLPGKPALRPGCTPRRWWLRLAEALHAAATPLPAN